MKISSYGGVIAAANEKLAFPLCKIGNTTAVQRIVMNYQQAGVFPIVIMSGAEEDEVRYQLSSSGVIFLPPEQSRPELFETVKTGFHFLQEICDKIVFTPVNVPLFSPRTLRTLMNTPGDIVSPSYRGSSGHPMIVSAEVIPEILTYEGEQGLRGAAASMKDRRVWVDVQNDDGILYTIHHGELPTERMELHHREILHLAAEMSLKKDSTVFDSRTKLLLLLIWKNRSVKAACQQMALSGSKAWEMLNMLEHSLDIKLVERRHGGAKGGRTTLSKQGLLFLREYCRMEEELLLYAQQKFDAFQAALRL